MQNKHEVVYLSSVLAAGTLWGFMGLFSRYLNAAGIGSGGVIILRCGTAAFLFFVLILITDPAKLKIRPRDFWCFLGTGICSMLFFTFCYFTAMSYVSLSTAAILLYTAPLFVVLFSGLLFKEPITVRKLVALALGFCGCCLVTGGGTDSAASVAGILYGLGAGLGYALYSIFAKLTLDRGYTSSTINLYTHLLAAVGAAALWGAAQPVSFALSHIYMTLFTLALGFFTCFLPYMLYTYSLTGLEAGKASICANIEPVVATLVGAYFFHEHLSIGNFGGIILVLSGVVLLSVKEKR